MKRKKYWENIMRYMHEENVDGGWITKVQNKEVFIPEGLGKPISRSLFVTRDFVEDQIKNCDKVILFKTIYDAQFDSTSVFFVKNIECVREVSATFETTYDDGKFCEWHFTLILN